MLTEHNNASTSSLDTLPPYVIASPPPCYSSDPASGEQRIDHSPRSSASRVPTSSFIKKNGSVTVVFPDQEEGVSAPTYGRQGKVEGILLLDKHESVSQVKVSLLGTFDFLNSEGGAKSISTVDKKVTLWSPDRGQCPASLSFDLTLPATFTDGDKSQPLPPSFTYSAPGVPGMVVTSVYAVLIHVSYIRRTVGFISKNKIFRVPLKYCPRARPNRPILPISLLCTVKTSPEEWSQTLATMKTRPSQKQKVEPIHINTFVPSVQIFALSDIIPIHVQLAGQLDSLRQFFPASISPSEKSSVSPVSVTILRQISVEVRGVRSWRSLTIGEGKIWPVPPTTSQLDFYPEDGEVLDWEGQVQTKPEFSVGGFTASGVLVKDFIMVTLTPPTSSPFLLTQTHVPIRLVTDAWIDVPDRSS